MSYQVVSVIPQDKKKLKICLDNGDTFILYKGEAAKLSLFEKEVFEETDQELLEFIFKHAEIIKFVNY